MDIRYAYLNICKREDLVVRDFLNWLVRNELHRSRVVRVAWREGVITNIKMRNDITSFTSYDKYHLGMGCVPLPRGSSQGQMELEIFRLKHCFGRSLTIGIFVFSV